MYFKTVPNYLFDILPIVLIKLMIIILQISKII